MSQPLFSYKFNGLEKLEIELVVFYVPLHYLFYHFLLFLIFS